jgi:hypothetical protein
MLLHCTRAAALLLVVVATPSMLDGRATRWGVAAGGAATLWTGSSQEGGRLSPAAAAWAEKPPASRVVLRAEAGAGHFAAALGDEATLTLGQIHLGALGRWSSGQGSSCRGPAAPALRAEEPPPVPGGLAANGPVSSCFPGALLLLKEDLDRPGAGTRGGYGSGPDPWRSRSIRRSPIGARLPGSLRDPARWGTLRRTSPAGRAESQRRAGSCERKNLLMQGAGAGAPRSG